MSNYAATNLRRLMASHALTLDQVVEASGLDRRTILNILDQAHRPQPRTINRLAEGLGVSSDEFFVQPSQLHHHGFDGHTNPVVREMAQSKPKIFEGWTDADFEELNSRFGAGGALTEEGTLDAVRKMNGNRQTHEKLALLLETSQADTARGMIELLYRQATEEAEP